MRVDGSLPINAASGLWTSMTAIRSGKGLWLCLRAKAFLTVSSTRTYKHSKDHSKNISSRAVRRCPRCTPPG